MPLKVNNKAKNIFSSILAATLCLSACHGDIDYPDGAESLPTYTTTAKAVTIYDTSAPPNTDIDSEQTTTADSSASEQSMTSLTEEETTSSAVTEPPETESDTSADTVTADTAPAVPISIDDIPQVGISEYYEKTQTQRTISTETEFSPRIISENTPSNTQATSSAPQPPQTAITSVSTAPPAESEGMVTQPSYSEATLSEPLSPSLTPADNQLKDGRISPYTGKEIISHPYSYYTLSDKDKMIYDRLVSSMFSYESMVNFTDSDMVTFQELYDIYQLIYNDEYRLFYISSTLEYITNPDSGYIMRMKFIYTFTKEETERMKNSIYSEAEKILSQITPEMNDYDIVKLFHDSIITSCIYSDEPENKNTVYGCLVDKKALCQGYSKAFTYLCSEAGIESFAVLGVADAPHMWNVVKMDEDYYHIDLTWDDPDRKQNPDSIRYDYFGLTDERIRELRQVDDYTYEVPAANGTKYQYYYYNNLVADSVEEAELILQREVLEASKSKRSTIQFMCTSAEVYDNVTSAMFSNSGRNVIAVLDEIKDKAANPYNTESIYHNSNRNTRTVKIFLDYLD